MSLGTIAGKLIKTAAGNLAASCECCRLCVYACYCHPAGWTVDDSPCPLPVGCCSGLPPAQCNQILATVAVSKPGVFFGGGVEVTITGAFDDDIAIDGVPTRDCAPAGSLSHKFVMAAAANSFDLGAVDSYGVCAGGALKICFAPCAVVGPPTLTVSGGSGSGATFTPTLSTANNKVWSLASVAVSGGTGYVNGESLTIAIAQGDTQVAPASAVYLAGRSAPELTIPGNATGVVSTQFNGDDYSVSAVTVTSGGSGYTDGQVLIFGTAADDVTVSIATAIARVAYTSPQNATVEAITETGSGAVFSIAWQLMPTPPYLQPNVKVYRPTITITNGGAGYADYDVISISFASPADGSAVDFVHIDADIVGPNGEIQQIYMDPAGGGLWRGAVTDALDSVALGQGGKYYKDDPNARAVLVTAAGSYYRCDANPFP